MKKETKIIISGAIITLAVLTLSIGLMYQSYNSKINIQDENQKTNEQNQDYKNETSQEEREEQENKPLDNKNETNTPNASNNNNAKNTVTVYVFYRNGCPYCENAITFFKSLRSEYTYLKIKAFEVSTNDNGSLLDKTASKLNLGRITAVPLIIIGDYSLNGYTSGYDETLKEEIRKAHKNGEYQDQVNSVREANKDLTVKEEDLTNAS